MGGFSLPDFTIEVTSGIFITPTHILFRTSARRMLNKAATSQTLIRCTRRRSIYVCPERLDEILTEQRAAESNCARLLWAPNRAEEAT